MFHCVEKFVLFRRFVGFFNCYCFPQDLLDLWPFLFVIVFLLCFICSTHFYTLLYYITSVFITFRFHKSLLYPVVNFTEWNLHHFVFLKVQVDDYKTTLSLPFYYSLKAQSNHANRLVRFSLRYLIYNDIYFIFLEVLTKITRQNAGCP